MALPGAPSDSPSPLGDLFANVNRPQLNAFVANSQARNGLLSAQTQDAMIKAAQAQEEQGARENIFNDFVANGAKPSEAMLARDIGIGALGNAEVMTKVLGQLKAAYGATPAEQFQGEALTTGKPPGPVATPPNYQMPPGSPLANVPVQQSPQGAAQTKATTALAGLNQHKNLSPGDFRNAAFGATSPEGQAALAKAVQEGRLDPMRVNARSAPILAQMEMSSPGMNFNGMHADAALQANAGFQQKAISMDAMPTILQHMTMLGKKLNGGSGYSDVRSVGMMQQWMNGQLNDPDYTEYMTVRNDALMKLASVMRGVGMSDQAHTAEIQAAAPTLSPLALDAWLKGQMSTMQPLLERVQRVENLGGGAGRVGGPGASAAPTAPSTAPPPLSQSVPSIGGTAAAPAPTKLPTYGSEQEALAAGHKAGDRVIIGGVAGTLQ